MELKATRNIRDAIIVLGLVLASWSLYRFLGLRFDPSPINGYWQFIDIILLQTRLIESIIFYHANPPFLNLFSGVGLQLFGQHHVWFFSLCYHLFGTLYALAFMVLVRELSQSRPLALVATAFLVFSPAWVLYQNWLMYTFPAASMVIVSAYCLLRVTRGGHPVWLHAFFVTLALLVLTRSVFHVAWLYLVILIGFWLLPNLRGRIFLAALAPAIVCTLWFGKNQLLFGQFASSTWLGFGVSNITTLMVPKEKLEPYVQDGTLSGFTLVSRYDEEKHFRDIGIAPTGIPVLDRVKFSTGAYNHNHRNRPALDPIYLVDGLKVAQLFPEYYLTGVWRAHRQFFTTNSRNPFFWPQAIKVFDNIRPFYDVVFYGAGLETEILRIPRYGDAAGFNVMTNPGYTIIVLWVLSVVFALRVFWRGVSGLETSKDHVVIGYLAFVMLYVYSLSVTVELIENYRYRFLVEAPFWVLVAAGGSRLYQRLVKRSEQE